MNDTSSNTLEQCVNGIIEDSYKALHLLHRQIVRIDGEGTTPHHDLAVLAMLNRDGSLPAIKIARRLSLPKSQMTQIIDKLVSEGLVVRNIDAVDRRKKMIEVTPEGLLRLQNYLDNAKANLKSKLSALDLREIEVFSEALRRIVLLVERLSSK